jgi:hypothetical protein
MGRPKTIQIYLPSGDPKASKIAEISSELGKLIFCSRKNIDFFKNRPESNYVGIYFLFGKTDGEKASAYIGEAEKLFDRLKTHLADKEKEWFSSIVFFTTKDNSFNKALVKYFESYCIDKAYEADRFSLMNRKSSSRANLSEALEADTEQNENILNLENLNENVKQLESIYSQKLSSLEELKQSILQKAFKGELTEVSS